MPKMTAASFQCLSLRLVAGLASTSLLAALAGCSLQTTGTSGSETGLVLGGTVHGGQAPITGSNVALFVSTPSSTSTYGQNLTAVANVQTNSAGTFSTGPLPANSCPAGSFAYLVSTGGNPGFSSSITPTPNNSGIFLVAAVGACGSFGSTPNIIINEVTTVAAAYALNGFAPAGGAGMTEAGLIGNGQIPGFTAPMTNVQGLSDAFLNAANLVNFATGSANSTSVGGNGTIPVALINTVADILQDCVNSTGTTSVYASPSGGSCSALFSAATSPTGLVPTNVFQAAINIANFPANNVSTLYGLVSAYAAFSPTLTAQPNDFSAGIVYTSSQLASPTALAVDKADNVYVGGSTGASLMEFSQQGALLSPAGGVTPTLSSASDPIRGMAFDNIGGLWLADGNPNGQGLYQYTPGGSPALTAQPYVPNASANPANYAVTTDAAGDIFTVSYEDSTCATGTTSTSGCLLIEYPVGTTQPYTATSTFSGTQVTSPGVGGARTIAYDVIKNNIWITDDVENEITLLTVTPNTTGAVGISSFPRQVTTGTTSSPNPYGTVSVAIDNSSNGWVVVTGAPGGASSAVPPALVKINPTTNAATFVCQQTQNAACGGLVTPSKNIVDGNGNIFIANTGGNSIVEYNTAIASSSISNFVSGTYGIAPGATVSGSALVNSPLYSPTYLRADRSGSLWTISSGTGSGSSLANLVQILGVAAPTNPNPNTDLSSPGNPINQYGVKP